MHRTAALLTIDDRHLYFSWNAPRRFGNFHDLDGEFKHSLCSGGISQLTYLTESSSNSSENWALGQLRTGIVFVSLAVGLYAIVGASMFANGLAWIWGRLTALAGQVLLSLVLAERAPMPRTRHPSGQPCSIDPPRTAWDIRRGKSNVPGKSDIISLQGSYVDTLRGQWVAL